MSISDPIERREYNRAWYQRHRNRLKKRNHDIYLRDKDKLNQRCQRYYEKHKEHLIRKRLEWAQKNTHKRLEYAKTHKLKSYGISMLDFNGLLDIQNNACVICKIKFLNTGKQKVCIDHDHTTGEVRGLLCVSCNSALGMFRDSILVLREAVKYMEER